MKGDCGKHFYKLFNCLYNIVGRVLLSFSMKYIKTMSRGAKNIYIKRMALCYCNYSGPLNHSLWVSQFHSDI